MWTRLDATPLDAERFGHKAAWLARAVELGAPVPASWCFDASWVRSAVEGGALTSAAARDLDAALDAIEADAGVPLGTSTLTLAVRSAPRTPQPGALPTVLHAGITIEGAAELGAALGSPLTGLDARRRFLRGLARALELAVPSRGVRGASNAPITASMMEEEVRELTALLGERSRGTPRQLVHATVAAIARHGEPLILQAMRYGNVAGGESGAGVASSIHPIQGEAVVFGEIAWSKQGEDLSLGRGAGVSLRASAAGRRASESLEARLPETFEALSGMLASIERRVGVPVEVEFVVQRRGVHVVQLRPTTLTPRAEVRHAVEWAQAGRIGREEALRRVQVASLLRTSRLEVVDEAELPAANAVLGRGLGASPGAASGVVAVEVEDAIERAARGERVVLIRSDASPEDAPAVRAAVAVATSAGGLTSHAAVMTRALGRSCAVSVSNLRVREVVLAESLGRSETIAPGSVVTVDGTRGLLLRGAAPMRLVADDATVDALVAWARAASAVRIAIEFDGLPDALGRAERLGADGVLQGDRIECGNDGATAIESSQIARWAGEGMFPRAPWVVVPVGAIPAARLAAAHAAMAHQSQDFVDSRGLGRA